MESLHCTVHWHNEKVKKGIDTIGLAMLLFFYLMSEIKSGSSQETLIRGIDMSDQ